MAETTIRISEVLFYIDIYLILTTIARLVYLCEIDNLNNTGIDKLSRGYSNRCADAVFISMAVGYFGIPIVCAILYGIYYFITTINWIW